MMEYETYTHPSGLRIICTTCPTDTVYCGIAVDSGTRDELPQESGMAHFTEHLSFKGTRKRSSRQIINRMESVGGDLNAYTGKEETVYYCTFLRPHVSRAIELLLDITLNSTYPQQEMDKEVEVVIDEIESYNDSPSELIYDDFEQLLYPNHPLGRNILGEAPRLRELRSADIQQYVNRMYRPDRMVLFVYGNVKLDEIVRLVDKCMPVGTRSAQSASLRTAPSVFQKPSSPIIVKKDTHQAHVMIGCRCYGATDPRHLSLYLLNNILGGPAMSSRLNLALRERNGLVYTVESNMSCYTDTGVWSVYFGCDPEDVNRCCRLVNHELEHLIASPMSQRTLDAARRQLKGQIGISYDNFESVAIGMGKRYLHYGKTQTKEDLFQRLDALTPDQLWQTARDILNPEHLTTLIYE